MTLLKILNKEIENLKTMTTFIAIISFVACVLTALFFIEKLPEVAGACMFGFLIAFGVTLGMMKAKNILLEDDNYIKFRAMEEMAELKLTKE